MDAKKRAYFNRKEFEPLQSHDFGRISRVFTSFIAILVIIGILHLSGIYQIQFFQRTPTTARQESTINQIDARTIKIPLTVFIVSSKSLLNSQRNTKNANHIVENASRVWNQAGIGLYIKNISNLNISSSQEELFLSNHRFFVSTVQNYDNSSINVFLVGSLGGINGLAFGGTNSVAVADTTSVFDFRVLAHEVGHRLGLSHTEDSNQRLMFRGANGTDLTLEEIEEARNLTTLFIKEN